MSKVYANIGIDAETKAKAILTALGPDLSTVLLRHTFHYKFNTFRNNGIVLFSHI